MKKFLIFLVIVIVSVSLGLTTYYFMRNDETISINTKEIYCNVGDIISLEDLNIKINKPHSFSKTTFNYNAGGEEVTSLINYDESKGYYSALKGGETIVVISTTNKRCPEFKISVHIGDGSSSNPYYIENQADLQKIGDAYALNANYILIADITLAQSFQPIGYNYSTGAWVGFSGQFNGNNHTISALNCTSSDYSNAGLFYSLNNAKVYNLTLNNATISGKYQYAGILAGRATGTISNIFVKNSYISNNLTNGVTGGIIGQLDGSATKLSTSSTENVEISLGSVANSINVFAGGLVGIINEAQVQATLASSKINIYNASGDIAGFAGRFIIGTNTGSIFEALSISTIDYNKNNTSCASFIATMQKSTNYNANNDQKLVHFAGNIVVKNGKVAIMNYDSTLYNTFFNETNSLYLVREVNTNSDLVALSPTDYVFYAVNQSTKTFWDSSAWTINPSAMPKLNSTNASLTTLSSQYLLKDLAQEVIGNVNDSNTNNVAQFLQYLSNNSVNGVISNKKIVLETDLDLTGYNYTPYALENCVFDGDNHTIKGLILKQCDSNFNSGLFTYINNSSVVNLTLEDISINIDALFVGAVAGKAYSSSSNSSSKISNVDVIYTGEINSTISNFGGVVGSINDGTMIDNTNVQSLSISSSSNISNAGGIVGLNISGTIQDCSINDATLYANTTLGGVAGNNSDNIINVEGNNINIKYIGNVDLAKVGGVAGVNDGIISGTNIEIDIEIANQNNKFILVGGIAGTNSKEIQNSTITGNGIEITSSANSVYVGGVVANNEGLISDVKCFVSQIGSYEGGRDFWVGGICVNNSSNDSKIEKCIVTSDIFGNYVAGITVDMDNASATVDQVYVGKFNPDNKELSKNIIKGDIYVAGASCNLSRGSITNIQLSSIMYGATNNTKTSLIVLTFPDGASLKYATVNSEFDGFGTFYKDTWKDFKQVSKTFYYNIYDLDSTAGSMQNVVINTESAKANGKIYLEGEINPRIGFFKWDSDYENTENSSFVKDVNSLDFGNAASFKGSFIIQDAKARVKYTKTLDFDFNNGTWVEGNGIRLSIVA